MTGFEGLVVVAAAFLVAYGLGILALLLAGRGSDARALAAFIPDCLVLLRRLLADPRVSRRRRAVLALLVVYLVLPIDLVPDFLPVIGQLDDVIVAALALRYALRSGGPEQIREHWPGPDQSLELVVRAAFGRAATTVTSDSRDRPVHDGHDGLKLAP